MTAWHQTPYDFGAGVHRLGITDNHAKMIIPFLNAIGRVEILFDGLGPQLLCRGDRAKAAFIKHYPEFENGWVKSEDPMVYHHEAWLRGQRDCYQDRCEGCPFASTGGLENRANLTCPSYILKEDMAQDGYSRSYLSGYANMARAIYGKIWQTCEFEFREVMTIGDETTPKEVTE